VHTADDDSVPVPYALKLPRAVLNWKTSTSSSRAEPHASTSSSRAEPRASTDALEDEPTRMMQVFVPAPTPGLARARNRALRQHTDAVQVLLARGTAYFDAARARAVKLWRDGPLRTAAMMGGVALVTYLAVGGVRHGTSNGTQTVLAPPAALPAGAPIIVEQLDGARQPHETIAAPPRGEQSDKPSRRSTGGRARETSLATTPASTSNGYQTTAPAKSKSRRAERSSATVSSSPAGLPAWGAEAVRDFSGVKSSKGALKSKKK